MYKMSGGTQTTTTRPNPAGDRRPPGIGSRGGLGFPDMENMFNGTSDASLLNQFLQNPAVSQMMQSLLSNPQYMNQVLQLGRLLELIIILFESWALSCIQ